MASESCFHCGLPAPAGKEIKYDDRIFCCTGCKTVYGIFSQNGLSAYYDLQKTPGATPTGATGKYDFLDNAAISEKLLEFREGNTNVIALHVPHIHCSSCIWLLENLHRLNGGITASQVNFPSKKVRITFDSDVVGLREIVDLMCSIGYEPNISLDDYSKQKKSVDRSLTLKLGVAFFCFGNIMLLSFPEYFEVGEYWLDQYKDFFRILIFLLALPSFLYSASGYYTTAWKSLKSRFLSIEIPIALGIIVMFVRSVFDMWAGHGPGFLDSMTGLIFFMLLGKTFQSKTYEFLNFERDYKSYFPVAVTRIDANGAEENIPIHEVTEKQRLLVRNCELIPCDGILISDSASIDYSFVTGESLPVTKRSGDRIFAGGKQVGPGIVMETLRQVSQSYLTELWSHEVFKKDGRRRLQTLTDRLSRFFTPALLLIALAGFLYWIFIDTLTAFNVFTAVLIIACPCALALTAPFTLGNVMRIMGRHALYLKNTEAIEKMAVADTIVFDKTGTLTTTKASSIVYEGAPLEKYETDAIRNAIRASNHTLSRMLYDFLPASVTVAPEAFEEITANGIAARVSGLEICIGSAFFTGAESKNDPLVTAVHVAINGTYRGRYVFLNQYRQGIDALFARLQTRFELCVLSGDNAGEREVLEKMLPTARLQFNQKPHEKLQFIKALQAEGKKIIMIGDGLNDAGALAQSDMGIALAENINIFSPACDAIMDAKVLNRLDRYLALSRKAGLIIKLSFGLSLLYNVVGLSWALSGHLSPLFAAVIMPLSTVTIVSFVTAAGNWFAHRCGITAKNKNPKPKKTEVTNVIFSEKATV